MIIQMTYQMSGGRYDGTSWPNPWVSFEVPDWEGEGLVYCGAAIQMTMPAAEPERKPKPEPKPEPKPVELVAPEPAAEPAPEPEPAVVKELPQPAPGDPKSAWVDYAVSRGASRAEAEDQTKAQLQATHGGRL